MKIAAFAVALTTTIAAQPASSEIFKMTCNPERSTPYYVAFDTRTKSGFITGAITGRTRKYFAHDVANDESHGTLRVAMRAPGQPRTVYLAFDYESSGKDWSVLRVKEDGGKDSRDKCQFTQPETEHADQPITKRYVREPPEPVIIYKHCRMVTTSVNGPYTGKTVGYEEHEVCD